MNNFVESILLNAKNILIFGVITNFDKDSFKVMILFQEKTSKLF